MGKKTVGFLAVVILLGLLAVPVLAATPEEIEASINSGLVWLDGQQELDGSWDFDPGITGLALLKFEDRAKELGFDPLEDDYAYHTTVQGGLNYLFSVMSVAGDEIYIADFNENYYTSIALLALSASNNPDTVVAVPGSAVNGMTYAAVAQGLLKSVTAAQQTTPVCAEGGWSYYPGYTNWADQSNTGYSVLSLTQAQAASPEGFGLSIPAATKTELLVYLGTIQEKDHESPVDFYGGSMYEACYNYHWENILKTGSLLQEHAFVGTPANDPAVLAALGYIEDHWSDTGPQPEFTPTSLGWKDSYQAMFCMMKGLQSYDIEQLDTDNDGTPEVWFDEVSDLIIANQAIDGSFNYLGTEEGDDNANLRAAWALLTLEKFVPPVPPSYTVEKDFRYTSVNFKPINCGTDTICGTPDDYQEPAILGMTLPDADADKKYEVKYVVDKKGKVTSTNPGQLYGVITITGAGVDTIVLNDAFGTQFDVNPAKLGGGVEVLRVDADGLAQVLTNTPQITVVSVDNDAGEVDLEIDLDTPLEANEKLMIYIKYQTTLKFKEPVYSDFLNMADVSINGQDLDPALATIEFI